MSHIEPIQGYRIHQSIKLTFCSPKFNMFENGLVKIKVNTFDNRKDRFLYRNITSRLDGSDVIYYFLSNILVGNTYPIADFTEGMQNFNDFMRRKESLSYIFKEELYDASLDTSLDTDFPEELYVSVNDNPPLIVSYILGGILSLETACLINLCCKEYLDMPYEDYIWKQKREFIKRYIQFFENGFILYDFDRIRKIYNTILV
ncbi:MAG: hypothetical protein PHG08_00215 [Bacilli bacterium]|nr:hypothetical protein [Bacilli bacterium]